MNGWRKIAAMAALVTGALTLGLSSASTLAAMPVGTATMQAMAAGTYVVDAGTTHHGGISLGVGTVVVRGTEVGSVNVGVGEVEVSGHVTGSVQVGMGQLVMTHDARVGGAVQVGAGQQKRLAPGVPLPAIGAHAGGVTVTAPLVGSPFPNGVWPPPRLVGGWLRGLPWAIGLGAALGVAGRLSWWLVSLAVAFVILSMFPEATRAVAADVEAAPWTALGWGLLVALAAGPASILLMITILGIPLALALGVAMLGAKVMGYVVVSLLLGARALPVLGASRVTAGWQLVAGTVLLLLVGSVPVLGWLVDVAVTLVGIGACGRTGFGTGRPWFRRPPPRPA